MLGLQLCMLRLQPPHGGLHLPAAGVLPLQQQAQPRAARAQVLHFGLGLAQLPVGQAGLQGTVACFPAGATE